MADIERLKARAAELPAKPGIYFFKTASGEVVYIGKARSLRDRVRSYFLANPDVKVRAILRETADIDNLLLLQKSGSWLGLVRAWNEGSACSGAILSQRMEGDNFLYARELTPVDLIGLAIVKGRLEINPHEDLEAGSESCFAAANYVYNLTQDREDLVSVRLYDEPAVDEKGRTDRYRYQSCFNRIYNAYLAEGRTALTPKDLDEFAARFRDECVKPGSGDPLGK